MSAKKGARNALRDARRDDAYALHSGDATLVRAPELPYRPRDPVSYDPGIALVGAGGITSMHLKAYRQAGYKVVALCDPVLERAAARRDEFYPDADVTTELSAILERDDVEVIDATTHPAPRLAIIEAALIAGKHVLSQKPFVLDLDEGERLADLADSRGLKLAVNQNGRWAPHFAYIRSAIRAGLIGEVSSLHCGVHWNHTWVAGTPFEEIEDLIFYDFAIHWFDFVTSLVGDRIERVYATRGRVVGQTIQPPMLAQALIEFAGGQASLVFDAHNHFGPLDTTYIGGTRGSLTSSGADLGKQTVTLFTDAGCAQPTLQGTWFPDGFHGAMAELLCAIEEGRTPENNARDNLRSLALCFAAIASSHEGVTKTLGEVRRLPGARS